MAWIKTWVHLVLEMWPVLALVLVLALPAGCATVPSTSTAQLDTCAPPPTFRYWVVEFMRAGMSLSESVSGASTFAWFSDSFQKGGGAASPTRQAAEFLTNYGRRLTYHDMYELAAIYPAVQRVRSCIENQGVKLNW